MRVKAPRTRWWLPALLVISAQATAQEASPRAVQILSEGMRMDGRFFSAGDGRHPAVLLLHGWPGNPHDVLGLGQALSRHGFHVLAFHPRGMHSSQGRASFFNALEDLGAAYEWLHRPTAVQEYGVDTAHIVVGGHSWGGGMALAFAARQPSVRQVFSIAGTDHGYFIRRFLSDPEYESALREVLLSTAAPDGPIRFDLEEGLQSLEENQDVFGLREIAGKLSDRKILLVGGWEDNNVMVDDQLLPFFRALRQAGSETVTFLVYHDGHAFVNVRSDLVRDLVSWMQDPS